MITEEQRDIIDNQIRERIAIEVGKENEGKFLPISAMIDARMSLGLGLDLENACPYMRKCDFKSPQLCIHQPYRNCSWYKVRLASDVLDEKVNLEGVVV